MNLTIQILAKSDKVNDTIQSIKDLDCEILIGNIGTLDIKNSIKLNIKNNAKCRNYLTSIAKNNWNMYLNEGDVLFCNKSNLIPLISREKNAYNFQIFSENILTKDIRLWDKRLNLKFKNYVYETLDYDKALYTNLYIKSNSIDIDFDIINIWKNKEPTNQDICYYEAIKNLQCNEYSKFINNADNYLFFNKSGISVVMLKYYYSIVKLTVYGDIRTALATTIQCLSCNPLMAEFWCLLGDIFLKLASFDKAIKFYENAMVLGKMRKKSDPYPMDLNKYKEYPEKMIKLCNTSKSKEFLTKKMN